MPLHLEVSRVHHLVTVLARGRVTANEIRRNTQNLLDANVSGFAKIIDLSGVTSGLTAKGVESVVTMLREAPGSAQRSPVAFVVNPSRRSFGPFLTKLCIDDGTGLPKPC